MFYPFLVFFGVGRSRRASFWFSSSLWSIFWASGRIWLRKSELQLLQTQNLAPMVNFDTWLKSGLLQLGQIGGLSKTLIQKRKLGVKNQIEAMCLPLPPLAKQVVVVETFLTRNTGWLTSRATWGRNKRTDLFIFFRKKVKKLFENLFSFLRFFSGVKKVLKTCLYAILG